MNGYKINQDEEIAKNLLLNRRCSTCFFNGGDNECKFIVPWNVKTKHLSKKGTCISWESN